MISLKPVHIEDYTFMATTVELPGTKLMTVSGDTGYIMCGALDVQLLNEKLAHRQIVAARALGVRSIDELIHAPLSDVTLEASKKGVQPGMSGKDALLRMHKQSD
ncbi:YunC family protein [Salsuginibacillus kocurii]|uniref:YunC family protein n=1 Tax=Salsuginibacillus kocurii TaxID=427078 RepID=UPI000370D7A9|nr:DUF1805 domain-containing protein [Salsuginibacillus kocurii]